MSGSLTCGYSAWLVCGHTMYHHMSSCFRCLLVPETLVFRPMELQGFRPRCFHDIAHGRNRCSSWKHWKFQCTSLTWGKRFSSIQVWGSNPWWSERCFKWSGWSENILCPKSTCGSSTTASLLKLPFRDVARFQTPPKAFKSYHVVPSQLAEVLWSSRHHLRHRGGLFNSFNEEGADFQQLEAGTSWAWGKHYKRQNLTPMVVDDSFYGVLWVCTICIQYYKYTHVYR